MRKQSAMGGGRFEFHPEELDRRKEIREDRYATAFCNVLAAIESELSKCEEDIVTRESLEEWLYQRLVQEGIKRRSYESTEQTSVSGGR